MPRSVPAAPGVAPPPAAAGDEQPLLVCLHGWLLAGRLWDPLRLALAGRQRLWTPDLPGFGGTPRPRSLHPTLASYGRWVAEQCLRLEERRVVLVGHSLGGSVALHAAPLLGDRLVGVIQIAAGGGVYQPRAFSQLRNGGRLFLQWRPSWLAELPGTGAIRSPLIAEQRAARSLLACSTNRGAVRQLPALVAGLQVPSLWIAGSRDQVMEPRYVRHLAGYSDRHELAELQGCGHLPMRQSPHQLADVIESWVQSLARPRS